MVADPDRLLTEPRLSEALSAKGFELLLYEDPVAFRFVYETKYRPYFDSGAATDLIILSHGDRASLFKLPCDLLARSQKTFIFPCRLISQVELSGVIRSRAAIFGRSLRSPNYFHIREPR